MLHGCNIAHRNDINLPCGRDAACIIYWKQDCKKIPNSYFIIWKVWCHIVRYYFCDILVDLVGRIFRCLLTVLPNKMSQDRFLIRIPYNAHRFSSWHCPDLPFTQKGICVRGILPYWNHCRVLARGWSGVCRRQDARGTLGIAGFCLQHFQDAGRGQQIIHNDYFLGVSWLIYSWPLDNCIILPFSPQSRDRNTIIACRGKPLPCMCMYRDSILKGNICISLLV